MPTGDFKNIVFEFMLSDGNFCGNWWGEKEGKMF